MSYFPAGEEDDYDSEDGFIDNGTTCKNEIQDLKSNFSNGHLNGHKQVGNGSEGRSVSWAHSDSRTYPRYQVTNVLSMEDLKIAAVKGNTELAERCLNQGLIVDEPLKCGWTALMYAGNYGQPDLMKLLLRKGADPNYHCDMFTALMSVCSACSHNEDKLKECIQILTEAGADVNAKDRFHTTALMLASKEGRLLVVTELIKHGADVNKQDSRGWTALTFATQRGVKSVVSELLNSGADSNIQHADRLTVKDLAAHLPTDEMLALLEQRPAKLVGCTGDMPDCEDKKIISTSKSYQTGDNVRYGELEVFLLGLDLSHLVDMFHQQLIDLSLLMTLTEQDLINAGVNQVGARKKLLDAIQALHKKDWQPSSLVSIHFNKQIRCSDAVAILANSSRHLRYIGSTVIYVREQLSRHPEQIILPTDRVNSQQLVRHIQDAVQNVVSLRTELDILQSHLVKEMRKINVDAPDLVDDRSRTVIKKSSKTSHIVVVVVGLCLSVLVWYNRDSLARFCKLL